MKQVSITLYLQGMSCPLCARRIEDSLRSFPGVSAAKADFGNRRAEVTYDSDQVSPEGLCAAVKAAGYGASLSPPGANLKALTLKLATLWGLYFLLEHFGVLNLLVPSQLADSSMGYGMLFVTGLLTSVHCLAMCGGISLSQSLAGVRRASLEPMLQYHLGRLISYVTLGAVLGGLGELLGGIAGLSNWFQGVLKLLAGLVMLLMGLNMLGLLPGLPTLPGIRIPRPKGLPPLAVGLLNGFMPCGPLQSMLLLALASGSALRGGISMLWFCLGTLPLLLGFGSLAVWLGKQFTSVVLSGGAVMISVFGLSMLSQGGSLTELFSPSALLLAALWLCVTLFLGKLPASTWKKALASALVLAICLGIPKLLPKKAVPDTAYPQGDIQVVESVLSSGSYPDIRVTAGIPVKWIIHADAGEINGCNNQIYSQALSIDKTFQPGDNIIEFTPPGKPGVYYYSCWMGMIYGTVTVE